MLANVSGTLLLAALAACSPQREPAPETRPATLLVVNADVRTADASRPRASAIAIRDGKFAAVGSSAELQALAGDGTTVIDAGGRTVLPGLIDGHTHLLSGAALSVGVNLAEIEDKQEWLRLIAEKARATPRGDWILGGAWDHNLSDGSLPDRAMLDAVTPHHPVLLRDIDGHSVWANSRAIELAGISADSPVRAGGEILLDPASGEMSGIFLEGAADLFDGAPGLADARDPVAGLKAAIATANSLGITTVHDMSSVGHGQFAENFLSVLDAGEMTLRIWQGVRPPSAEDATPDELFQAIADERGRVRRHVAAARDAQTAGPLFDLGYVKLIVDGVLSTHTAMLKAPYADDPQASAEPFVSKERLNALIAAAHRHDFPVAVHAIGDEAVSWVLDGFAASPSGDGMPPDRIEHIEVVTEDDIRRFRQLGVAASMQPHHATCCVGNYVIERLGRNRLPNAYAWRALLDHGVPLVLGSDWPTSPFDPLLQMADSLHRETRIDGVVRPWDEGNTLTFDEALHGYTQAGANLTAWAAELGSIAPGKWADFVILDGRVTDEVARDLEAFRVSATYLAGRQVFPRL